MSHPSANLLLRLNTPALNALFPEDTPARVDLQNAVLAQAASRYVKGIMTDAMRDHLDAVVIQVARQVDAPALIAESFVKRYPTWSNLELLPSGEMVKAIATAVKLRFEEALATRVEAEVEAALARAGESLEAKVARQVQIKVDQLTGAMMHEKVNAAFAAAGLTVTPAASR